MIKVYIRRTYGENRIAALSKIADILSDNNKSPIIPEVDVWKKVFNNAELGDLYEEREPQFIVKIQPYGYGPEERKIYFIENCMCLLVI